MSIVDHEDSAEFAGDRELVFEALVRVVPSLQHVVIASADPVSGRVVLKTDVSWRSWGENVPISVTQVAPGRSKVTIISTPKTGVLFGGLFDLGKNRENIEKIFSALAAELHRQPGGTSPQWVYCESCGGGNNPGAAFCQWCAAPLPALPAAPPSAATLLASDIVLVATFGQSTAWHGKRITREAGVFVLEGHGSITARDIMRYDQQGHLTWATEGSRAWIGGIAASEKM